MKPEGSYKFVCPQDLDGGPKSVRGNKMGSSDPVEGDVTYSVEILEAGVNPPML